MSKEEYLSVDTLASKLRKEFMEEQQRHLGDGLAIMQDKLLAEAEKGTRRMKSVLFTLQANVHNQKLSDADFRQFVSNTLEDL